MSLSAPHLFVCCINSRARLSDRHTPFIESCRSSGISFVLAASRSTSYCTRRSEASRRRFESFIEIAKDLPAGAVADTVFAAVAHSLGVIRQLGGAHDLLLPPGLLEILVSAGRPARPDLIGAGCTLLRKSRCRTSNSCGLKTPLPSAGVPTFIPTQAASSPAPTERSLAGGAPVGLDEPFVAMLVGLIMIATYMPTLERFDLGVHRLWADIERVVRTSACRFIAFE